MLGQPIQHPGVAYPSLTKDACKQNLHVESLEGKQHVKPHQGLCELLLKC